MASVDWTATYETTPADTAKRHQGDDRMREDKLAVRETLQQGGHDFPGSGITAPAATADNNRGRHVVDAGGSGVSPHEYESDGTTILQGYYDDRITQNQHLQSLGIRSTQTDNAATTYTLTYNDRLVLCKGASADQTLTLPAYAAPDGYWKIYKQAGYALTLATDGGSGTFETKRGTIAEADMIFPDNYQGWIELWSYGTDTGVVDWEGDIVQLISSAGNINQIAGVVLGDPSGGTFAAMLPAIAGALPYHYLSWVIHNISSTNNVTITVDAGPPQWFLNNVSADSGD